MKINKEVLEENAKILKALGHPTRLCIVKGLIDQGKNNVSYIQECLEVPQSTLSQYLANLRATGIIVGERKGTEVYYRVSNEMAKKVIEAIF